MKGKLNGHKIHCLPNFIKLLMALKPEFHTPVFFVVSCAVSIWWVVIRTFRYSKMLVEVVCLFMPLEFLSGSWLNLIYISL